MPFRSRGEKVTARSGGAIGNLTRAGPLSESASSTVDQPGTSGLRSKNAPPTTKLHGISGRLSRFSFWRKRESASTAADVTRGSSDGLAYGNTTPSASGSVESFRSIVSEQSQVQETAVPAPGESASKKEEEVDGGDLMTHQDRQCRSTTVEQMIEETSKALTEPGDGPHYNTDYLHPEWRNRNSSRVWEWDFYCDDTSSSESGGEDEVTPTSSEVQASRPS